MFHFIGIKGSGMSALAQIMHNLGYTVQGSDVEKEFFTEIGLRENNIAIFTYDKDNIKDGMEIVLGNVIENTNEELVKAKELGLNIYSYQEMIGKLTKDYRTIAITGCHGKTTTTAMLSHVLNNITGCNYLIGDGTGHAAKENKYFILEACEYKRHFLAYYPKYTIITNIELDHGDYYKDIDDVVSAYKSFVAQTEEMVIAWGDDKYTRTLDAKNIIYYGLNENNDVIAKNVNYSNEASKFDVYIKGDFYAHFDLPFFGEHQILNSLAVITTLYLENINKEDIIKYLSTFSGAKRRFAETKFDDTVIVDDYAHHPTEINATINAAKQKYPNKDIIAIFQPHTFSRTKLFASEYVDVLNLADKAYVLPLHPSREKQEDYPDVSEQIIINKLDNGAYLEMTDAEKLLPHKNAVLLFMGANDLTKLEDATQKIMMN